MTPKRLVAWAAATTGSVASTAGSVISGLDGDWAVMLLFIVVAFSAVAVVRLTPSGAVELRPDIARWVDTAAALQGESPETVVNRSLSRQRALRQTDSSAVEC